MLKEGYVWLIYTLNTKSLHKYTRKARDQDGVEVMSMRDLVQVKKDKLQYVLDMRTVKGMG